MNCKWIEIENEEENMLKKRWQKSKEYMNFIIFHLKFQLRFRYPFHWQNIWVKLWLIKWWMNAMWKQEATDAEDVDHSWWPWRRMQNEMNSIMSMAKWKSIGIWSFASNSPFPSSSHTHFGIRIVGIQWRRHLNMMYSDNNGTGTGAGGEWWQRWCLFCCYTECVCDVHRKCGIEKWLIMMPSVLAGLFHSLTLRPWNPLKVSFALAF